MYDSTGEEWILALVIAAFLGIIPAIIAKAKGRDGFLWWLYGAALFIVALIHALVLQPTPEALENQQLERGMMRCASCAEWIHRQARVCPHCGLARTPVQPSPSKQTLAEEALPRAASIGDTSTVRDLLIGGTNANSRDSDGRTALHLAAAEGHTDTVAELILGGAERNPRDSNGRTPLHLAVSGGHKTAVQCLVGHRAEVSVKDQEGRTPLQIATARGDTEIAELLRQCGATEEVQGGSTQG